MGTLVENNILKVIQSETETSHSYTLDRSILFKTFSTNGYSLLINDAIRTDEFVYKISANSKDLISSERKSNNKFYIIDYNKNNLITKRESFNGKYVSQGSFHQYYPKSKYNISTEIKDGYVYVYYITSSSSPYFLNSTKLSINSVSGNLISGIIETQNTNQINIQSSENIYDWKTIQTINNPSGKQFFVPIEKNREFIRAVE